jgi:hypothetical protein
MAAHQRRRSNHPDPVPALSRALDRGLPHPPPGTSWTGEVLWDALTPPERTLRIIELILADVADPRHPIHTADPSRHRAVALALDRALALIRTAATRYASDHGLTLPS